MADSEEDQESPVIAYILATGTLLVAACLMCICLMCCAKCPEWRRHRKRQQDKEKYLKYCSKVKYSIKHDIKNKTPCDSCAICLDEFIDKEVLVVCPCRHAYHKNCICDWLVHSPCCPICKERIIQTECNQPNVSTPLLA